MFRKSVASSFVLALSLFFGWPQDIGRPGVGGDTPSHGQPGVVGPGTVASVYDDATACWSFNDTADLGNDDCTNTYDLTLVNTPTATGGALGYAMALVEASNQVAYVADDAVFDTAGGDFSWSIWLRPSALTGESYFLGKLPSCATASGGWYANLQASGAVLFGVSTGAADWTETSTDTISVGERAHVLLEWDESVTTLGITINGGTKKTKGPWGTNPTNNNEEVTFGQANRGCPSSVAFSGSIDSAAFFKGKIVTTAQTYNSGKGYTCEDLDTAVSGMSACYDFETDGGPYTDYVGSNNLTAVNTPTQAPGLVERSDSGMSANLVAASSQRLTVASQVVDVTGDFAISGWFNNIDPGAGNVNYSIFSTVDGSNASYPAYRQEGQWAGNYRSYTRGGWGVGLDRGNLNSTWVMWVYEWDQSTTTTRVKVIGCPSNDNTWTSADVAAQSNNSFFSIGGVAAEYQDGATDNVGVWPRLLTDDEITTLYNSGSGTFYSAYWDAIFDGPRFAWSDRPQTRRIYIR